MTGREILQERTNKQLTWTWWIITWPPNLNGWKSNLAREAHSTIDLILIRNQSTYIEKKAKKQWQNKTAWKNRPIFKFLLSFSLVQLLFLLKQLPLRLSSPSNSTIASDACNLPSLPPQRARSEGSGSGDSSWSCKHLAVAACKSFPPAYADQRLHCQIKTWLISLISPPSPLPPSPTTKEQSIITAATTTVLPHFQMHFCYH